MTKEDGSENASATIYEITRHDVQTRTEKCVVIAIFEANSTTGGELAFLDGMIPVGQADVDQAGNTDISLWEFETGIPYVKDWMELLMMSRIFNCSNYTSRTGRVMKHFKCGHRNAGYY